MRNNNLFICGISLVLILNCGPFPRSVEEGGRRINPADIIIPDGYRIEVIAEELTFPTGVTFDEQGRPCVVESGYAYHGHWTTPRLLRIEKNGEKTVIAEGAENGPWNGVYYHLGNFYVAEGGFREGGKILKISPDGEITVLLEGLPSIGDHHTNGPVVGPDGWLYFGQGTATNSGVVGLDNAEFGWLERNPDFHDIPGQNIVLEGRNFETLDPLDGGTSVTGAFLPFGTRSEKGQVIEGRTLCTGAIIRMTPEGDNQQLVAWGFRNPYAIAFKNDSLFVINNGYDIRGSRPVFGSADHMWVVEQGVWYGWPDYDGNRPLTDDFFNQLDYPHIRFLLAEHPNIPPRPVLSFPVHSSSNGLDFSRGGNFGYKGQGFVAQLGDMAPDTGAVYGRVGFKVVRFDIGEGVIDDFVINRGRINGPASRLGSGGLERPVSLRFDPSGDNLYIVDFGVMEVTRLGVRAVERTGVLWRISRIPETNDQSVNREKEI